MSHPHVLHVVISLDHGGLERQVLAWARERNHLYPESTTILCLDRIGNLGDEASGLPVHCIRSRRRRFPWDRDAVRNIRWEIQRREAAGMKVVIHSHNLAAWQYAVLASRGTTAHIVHTQHGANLHDHGWINTIRVGFLRNRTDRLVTVSCETALEIAAAFRIPESEIQVVPNGIDTSLYDASSHRADAAALRKIMGMSPESIVIGYVGRLAAIKGPDRLIRAYAEVTKSLGMSIDVRLLMVGDGPMRSSLDHLAATLGVDMNHVHFVGFQSDPRPYFAVMNLFVLPSRSEGLSIALLEALAMYLPVVVTGVGGNADVLGDETGVLLDADDSKWGAQLVREVHRVLAQDPGLAGRVDAGRRRVERGFSLTDSVDQYEVLYIR